MLYLVRHGTTEFNSRAEVQEYGERIRGWLNISLDDDGRQQARDAAEKLKTKYVNTMFHSVLKRAEETCEEISNILNIEYSPSMGLTPWNIGMINGMLLTEAIPLMTDYFERPLIPIPQGESYSEFYNRWKSELFSLLKMSEKLNIVAVTHSRNMYCLQHVLTHGEKPIVFKGLPLPGGVVEVNPITFETNIL